MKVFLSYDERDKETAEGLASRLSQAGHDVWWADGRILPGDNWGLEVGKALEECEAMVVLLSPAALASRAVRGDINFALSTPSYADRLIPVQVATTPPEKIPWILRKLKIIRFGPTNRAEAVRRIVERLEHAPV